MTLNCLNVNTAQVIVERNPIKAERDRTGCICIGRRAECS